ncbi:MAG: SH3 domain-containing protein, partial [Sedimentisphaerales bacterium]|nr:SH3 domain-containing protein [Sedimentisphaerales bacterium]
MDNIRKNHVTVTIIGVFVAFCSSLLMAQDHAGGPTPSVNDQTADELVTVPVIETAAGSAEAASTSVAEASKLAFEPYLGVITGDNVNIRSGPAEIYYAVGKLRKGQQVVVSGERHGKKNWAMIEPTDQCFSYISKKYVVIQDVSDVPDSAVLQETPPLQETIPSATAPAVSDIPADSPADASLEKTVIGDDKLGQPPIAPVEKPAARKFLRGMVTGNFVRVRVGSIKVPPVNARQVQTRLNYGAVVQVIGERDDFYKIVPPP